MSGAPLPPVIPEPFGNNADPSNITIPPDTTSDPGRASFSLGFPPLTMTPVAAGGKPPFGQDVNGILNVDSAHAYFTQAGQIRPFSTDVSTVISGYAVGARVASTDGQTIWYNLVAGNTTDPDGGSAAGWTALFTYGGAAVTGLTGGTVVLTPVQWKHPIISLSGAMTSNLVIVLPNLAVEWLIVNLTSGAFTTTVRTAGGTGVTVPQGGASNPVGVYGDGTNIYPAISPLAVPISQSWDPLTLAERDNIGRLLATDFVTNSTPNNFGFVNGFYDDGDGTIRKITKANFQASLALSAFAGQVTASQVPLAAVIQYVASILASAPLTGTPTAPTAAVGNSTTQVATTAFANPSQSKTINGSAELPGGVILQWGVVGPVADGGATTVDAAVVFAPPFPTACVFGIATSNRSVAANGVAAFGSGFSSNRTPTGMTVVIDSVGGGVASGVWFAVGF